MLALGGAAEHVVRLASDIDDDARVGAPARTGAGHPTVMDVPLARTAPTP